ncbi:MAG: DUF3179 domain-containing protein [Longimicrobiales bacterium]|nr:DUF3179 domain-containing protein [Longimicrobiales bacterium]
MAGACAVVLSLAACQESGSTGVTPGPVCELDRDLLIASLPPNAIPALNEPVMVTPDDPGASYLLGTDRVLGVVVDGEARAYPHNIFWWHEIVNDRIGDRWISVTFCPLTGSGLGFDPNLEDHGRLDLGVSGLLFANNLVMYDRESGSVYGPQLEVEGSCDAFVDEALALAPVREMSWARWQELHPDTKVVSVDLTTGRNYREYPYGDYDQLESDELLVPMQVDRSRAIKERVLAIRVGDGGRGYPFLELQELGSVAAVNELVGGVPTVIFYEEAQGMSAVAYEAQAGGQTLTFQADEDSGLWVDDETGSTWGLDGMAVAGPLQGERLSPRADAYVLFWFAWRHFQPSGSTFAAP